MSSSCQFSFSQSNLWKQNEKASRENMLNFKIRERALCQKCQRGSASFRSQSSARPSGDTDFPFSCDTLHSIGAWIPMNSLGPPRADPMLLTTFPRLCYMSETFLTSFYGVSADFCLHAACTVLPYFFAANHAWKTGTNKMDKCGSEWTVLLQLEVHGE